MATLSISDERKQAQAYQPQRIKRVYRRDPDAAIRIALRRLIARGIVPVILDKSTEGQTVH